MILTTGPRPASSATAGTTAAPLAAAAVPPPTVTPHGTSGSRHPSGRLGRLRAGFGVVARMLGGTLGPIHPLALHGTGRGSVELLSDSATLARRITSLSDPDRSAGAAIGVQLVRAVGERYGDGGATAAVLAEAICDHAVRMVAAGANPVPVADGIRSAVETAAAAVEQGARPVADEAALTGLALAATADPELATAAGELAALLGGEGAVSVESWPGTGVDAEPVDGARWPARPGDRDLLTTATELTLAEPAIAVVDAELDRFDDIAALLTAAKQLPDRPSLVIVTSEISDLALAALRLNDRAGTVLNVPVVLTTARTRHTDDLTDLALLTAGRMLSADLGCPPAGCRPEHLGRAARVLVQRGQLTITGGRGDATEIAEHARVLRGRARATSHDPAARRSGEADRLWVRQARLAGRTGILRVGALLESELDVRIDNARRIARLLRHALDSGVVPGGGVGFLDAVPAVTAARLACPDPDRAAGVDAVLAGLSAPFCRILANAGDPTPAVALAHVRTAGPGHGVDATQGRLVEMRGAGICDPAATAAGALRAAGHTAALLVTAEVVTGRG